MTTIEFYKREAKKLLKDYKSSIHDEKIGIYEHNPHYYKNIDEIIATYKIPKDGTFTLMKAQHIIAKEAGFYNWNELIKKYRGE